MTGGAWLWIGGISVVWVAVAYYFLFVRVKQNLSLVGLSRAPKEDSEVIVSNTRIMINVFFADEEKVEATPALLADMVISFKDIVNGTYKVPELTKNLSSPVVVVSETVLSDPGEKKDTVQDDDQSREDEIPDLSNEPELPELDPTENIPEREADSKVVLDESQLVDSNTLILNMLNLN